jgi:hypothetical protein
MVLERVFGSLSIRFSLKYFARVLFPLPGFPSMYRRLEVVDVDHSRYCGCFQSHSSEP